MILMFLKKKSIGGPLFPGFQIDFVVFKYSEHSHDSGSRVLGA